MLSRTRRYFLFEGEEIGVQKGFVGRDGEIYYVGGK
jgi:hypothetical protein